MCTECQLLIKSIDAYIAKENDKLADELKKAGFAEASDTVRHSEELEEKIAEILEEQSEDFEELLKKAEESGIYLKDFIEDYWKKFKAADKIGEKLFPVFFGEFSEYIPALSNVYISQLDSELTVTEISEKTSDWIAQWSYELADELKKAGFAEASDTVRHSEELEEKIAEILEEQSEDFEELLKKAEESGIYLKDFIEDYWKKFKAADKIGEKLFPVFFGEFSEYIPALSNVYISQLDSELTVTEISEKTSDWIAQWSYELADIMKLSSHNEIEGILQTGLKEGKSIHKISADIAEHGIRDTYYKAKRAALTETLRAHSVAREESIQQCPAAEYKEWVHTSGYRIEPRLNHIKMNGQAVPKNQTFTLIGVNGNEYHPAIPRDPVLPPEESINCHCVHRGIVSEDILGLPLEERKKLQQKAIEEIDSDRFDEMNEREKAKAGINEDTIKCDWLKNKTVEERKTYFRSDSRWALFESGVIQNDADLEKLYKTVDTPKGKRKVFKSLTELKDDGIITVPDKTIKHSTVGDYINSSKDYPNGRLKNGGHSQKCIDELKNKGIDYKITKVYDNGVRLGYVPEHKQKTKQSGIGQSWFPETWDDNEVLKAGTYTANNSRDDGMPKFAEYNGVRVGIFLDSEGNPSTIFPDNSKQP